MPERARPANLKDLRDSGWVSKSVKQEIRDNFLRMLSAGDELFPGTVGYDLAFVRQVPTATGSTIRFVTNRKIAFGEAYRNTQSQAYNLTGGEINIDNQNKDKSAGVLYPAAQLTINKDGDLQIELRKNPWRLTNIIVRGEVEKK